MSTNLSATSPIHLILGTDKKNPVLIIYQDKIQKVLHIIVCSYIRKKLLPEANFR